jgi:hypothetical protein
MGTEAVLKPNGIGWENGGTGHAPGTKGVVPPRPGHAPAAGRGTGSQRLDVLVKSLETIQLSDQHDLHQLCEAFRQLSHRLAVEAMMASGELEAGAKAMAKAHSAFGVVGFSATRKIKRTVKALRSMADSYAAAGGSAAAAWNHFQRDFEEDLTITRTKPAARRGFSINPG